jgi:heptose-I-phosphate ethanolaminephosphotransferase
MRYVKYTKKLSTLSENHKNRHWDVSTALSDGTPHTFVIIIGEATSVFHQSIYGYHRQTTPNLDSMRNELIVFENTYAPATSTTASLEKVLSFATRERPDDYMEKPLITELFNDAGFTTYWISKQNIADGWQSGIYVIAAQKANYLFDVSKSPYDDAVLPTLQEALNDTAKNKLIFIHLMGAHIKYKERYPKEFDKFDHKKENLHGKAFQTETMLRTIDEYDNAILYNDYILSRITKILEAQNNTSSYMCFFADHGEEVYDNRPFMGHASRFPVPIEQLRIPLILWQNEAYKAEFPNLTYDTSKEFNTENLIYKIEEWSGIHYK